MYKPGHFNYKTFRVRNKLHCFIEDNDASLRHTYRNGNKPVEEEIKRRLTLANKAYVAKNLLFRDKLISRMAKLKLYPTIEPLIIIILDITAH